LGLRDKKAAYIRGGHTTERVLCYSALVFVFVWLALHYYNKKNKNNNMALLCSKGSRDVNTFFRVKAFINSMDELVDTETSARRFLRDMKRGPQNGFFRIIRNQDLDESLEKWVTEFYCDKKNTTSAISFEEFQAFIRDNCAREGSHDFRTLAGRIMALDAIFFLTRPGRRHSPFLGWNVHDHDMNYIYANCYPEAENAWCAFGGRKFMQPYKDKSASDTEDELDSS